VKVLTAALVIVALVVGYLLYPAFHPAPTVRGGCVHNLRTGASSCSADALGRPTLPARQDCDPNDAGRFAGEALCSWYLHPLPRRPRG
jgi:hypothetical protein